jgi:hypothetical protein
MERAARRGTALSQTGYTRVSMGMPFFWDNFWNFIYRLIGFKSASIGILLDWDEMTEAEEQVVSSLP